MSITPCTYGLSLPAKPITITASTKASKKLKIGPAAIVDPDAEEITDKEHSLAEKNVWARISIIAAGPIFNFLLAFVLAVIVIGFAGSDKPYVQGVIDKYPAQEAKN